MISNACIKKRRKHTINYACHEFYEYDCFLLCAVEMDRPTTLDVFKKCNHASQTNNLFYLIKCRS